MTTREEGEEEEGKGGKQEKRNTPNFTYGVLGRERGETSGN